MITTSATETFGLPINQTVAFSNHKGVFNERLKKQQLKMLKPFAAMLKQFLEPGEEVLLAMQGCSPMSFMEQLTTGWVIYYLKRCILVVTNVRILHIPAKGNFSPRHSIAQIRFGDVEEIKPSSFLGRKFAVKYKNGKKETFLYLKDMKKFKVALDDIGMAGHQPTPYGMRHHLCPRCTAPLPLGEYVCSSCKLEFKNERKARNISILAPGGGYFYTGHPFMGLGDALVESILILVVFMALVNILMGKGGAEAVTQFVVFGIILFLEKLYTIYHAMHYVKEYIPVDNEFQPLSSP